MSQDTSSYLVESYLQNLALSYSNPEVSFVADKIFGLIDGMNRKAKVFKYVKGDQFRIEVKERGKGGNYPNREVRGSQVPIAPKNWAVQEVVPIEDFEDAKADGNYNYDPEEDAMDDIGNQFLMKKEELMSGVIHSETWNGVAAGGEDAQGLWGTPDPANDTFIDDVETRKETIASKTGVMPNKMMMTLPAWTKIAKSPKWNDKVTTNQQIVTPDIVGNQLNLQIYVASAIQNVAIRSDDPDSFQSKYIMSPDLASNQKGHAFLYYAPDVPKRKQLSVGYQYRMIKELTGVDIEVRSHFDEDIDSWKYKAQMELDFATMCKDCGFLWKNTAIA
jgi:hypothetical protein